MKTLHIEDVQYPGMIQDAYMTCKYLERQGIPLDTVTLGNVHDSIEEAVDDNQLPITQVVIEKTIEGYLIGA